MRLGTWVQVMLCVGLVAGCGGEQQRLAAPDGPELVGVWYTVEAGDTVSRVAKRHQIPVSDVVELNGLVDPDRLERGQRLFLYGVDEVLRRHSSKSPRAAGGHASKKPRFRWPIDGGKLTSGFGKRGRRMHKGVDIAAPLGTGVVAAAAGKVIYSDDKQRGYGNLVILHHADGYVTVYAHNRRNLVDEGETVRQGSRIAEVGSTGRSTGPHLHFEIRHDSKAIDPLARLPAR